MNFEEFKSLVCNKVEDKLKPTISIAFFHPYINENGELDLFPDEAYNLIVPLVNINVVTDFYNEFKFLELNLKYQNANDNELRLISEKLAFYAEELTKTIDDDTKRPALSVSILPSGKYIDDGNPYLLEMAMPLQIGVISKNPGEVANTITMLFLLGKCNLSEIEDVDLDEAKKEAQYDDGEAIREQELLQREMEEKQAFLDKQEKDRLLAEEREKMAKDQGPRKVGRTYEDEE